jgi:phosphoesterase RecJ-like protein
VFNKEKVEALKSLLATTKKIVVTAHKNPDGDALGSSLAWMRYLSKLGHSVEYISPNDYPDYYKWLPIVGQTIVFEKAKEYAKGILHSADIIFSLDYNSLSRMEELGEVVKNTKAIKVMIDHHLFPDDYADIMFSHSEASSTGEMIYDMIVALGDQDKIDVEIAELLYTAILTDTGSFAYSCTTSHVHEVVSVLLTKGANPDKINNKVYNCFTESRLRFLGFCVAEKMKIIEGTQIAYIGVSEEELRRFNIQDGETEGIASYPLKIAEIQACAFFREKDKKIRISFRSKVDFDVNVLAREHFNGGGHKNAAGAASNDTLENTLLKFVSIFKQ